MSEKRNYTDKELPFQTVMSFYLYLQSSLNALSADLKML